MYNFVTTDRFDRDLRKLDKGNAKLILKYIKKNLINLEDPRSRGRALVGDKSGLLRYRIGDYRLICKIEDEQLIILALSVGHRREVYSK